MLVRVAGVGAAVRVLFMVDLSATMAGVDGIHERREKGMTEGIRCGCAGMGTFSNAYNHQRGSGADIAARSGSAIRTESSALLLANPRRSPLPPYQPVPPSDLSSVSLP